MPKQQTEKSRYPSKYSPKKFVTARQYIIELICERIARHQKEDLGVQFWKNKEWAGIYKRWLRVVGNICKDCPPEAIIRALNNNPYRWSLHTDFMVKEIEKEKEKLVQEKNKLRAAAELAQKSKEQEEKLGAEDRGKMRRDRMVKLDMLMGLD
jgi:hypothetical protein